MGDQVLWRSLAVRSHGTVDLLQAIDSRYRGERFRRFGVIDDPDCKQANAPDEYGLWLDVCTSKADAGPVGEPAGIVGLRRFRNPKFDANACDLSRYLADPAKVEPPYLTAWPTVSVMWASIRCIRQAVRSVRRGEIFTLISGINTSEQIFNTAKYPETREMKPDDFRWQVAHTEPPGTSDTSQVATDHIDHASSINMIVDLNDRPMHTVVTANGVSRQVFHVLKDGADSVGSACLDDPTERRGVNDTACAAMRGSLNIGVCANVWLGLVAPVYGMKRGQAPFHIKSARRRAGRATRAGPAPWLGLKGWNRFCAPWLRCG